MDFNQQIELQQLRNQGNENVAAISAQASNFNNTNSIAFQNFNAQANRDANLQLNKFQTFANERLQGIKNQGQQTIQNSINESNLNIQNLKNQSYLNTAEVNAGAKVKSAQISALAGESIQGLKNEGALNLANQNFGFQQSLSKLNFGQNAALGFAGFAGSLINTGLNFLTAKSLLNTQAALQRQNFDYMTDKQENAFTSNGLPSWLAFTGGKGLEAFPHQTQALSGSNFFSSSLPGNTSNLAWTGSQSQLALGVGQAPQIG